MSEVGERMSNVRYRRRTVKQATREVPTLWCRWGKHEFIPLAHLNESLPEGVMCFGCQAKIAENVQNVLPIAEISIAERRAERMRREDEKAQREAEGRVKRNDPNAPGFVYYIRIDGQIKIGFTTDLKQRSRHYPPTAELVAIEAGTTLTERDRHQQFHRDLARGREWFTESEALTTHMAELQNLNGVPTELMHQYTTRRK